MVDGIYCLLWYMVYIAYRGIRNGESGNVHLFSVIIISAGSLTLERMFVAPSLPPSLLPSVPPFVPLSHSSPPLSRFLSPFLPLFSPSLSQEKRKNLEAVTMVMQAKAREQQAQAAAQ